MITDIQLACLYAGIRNPDAKMLMKMEEIAGTIEKEITPSFTWIQSSLHFEASVPVISRWNLPLPGKLASTMLQNCKEVLVFGASLTMKFDRILARLQKQDMAEAILFDACGSAFLEAFLDSMEEKWKKEFSPLFLSDRFSCGYGDLPLSLQKDFADHLQLSRKIGVYLSASYMMNPTKSVTGLIGISEKKQLARIRGCAYCGLSKTCQFRKEGKTCAVS